jgi:hypothetical protein
MPKHTTTASTAEHRKAQATESLSGSLPPLGDRVQRNYANCFGFSAGAVQAGERATSIVTD